MKRFTLILSLMVAMVTTAMAGDIVASTNEASPEKVFTMVSGNNASVGADAAPGDGRFAFFAVENVENAYYIYSVTNNKWFSYAKADSYSNGTGFVTLSDTKENYFYFEKCTGDKSAYYQIRPYNNSGVAAKYLNYFGGASAGVKLGLWQDNGNADGGSRYLIEEYEVIPYVTSPADITSTALYTIAPNDAGRGVLFANSTSAYLTTTALSNQNVNDVNQQFMFITKDEKTYLYSVGANKFVNDEGKYLNLTAAPKDYVVVESADVDGHLFIKMNGRDLINVSTGWNYGALADWNTADNGNRLRVRYVDEASEDLLAAIDELFNSTAKVTYNFICNGVTLATQTATVNKGEAFPAFNVTLPLGYRLPAIPEGNVTATVTKDITVTVDNSLLPFEAVAEGTPTTWYYAQMHYYTTNNYSYRWFIAPAEDGSSVRTQDHEFAADEVDAHLWGFVGTVEGGFKMVNKATSKAIKSTNGGVAEMAEVADATAFIATGSKVNADWFCMKNPAGNYLNAQGSVANASNCNFVINHWSDNDGGSSFFLTEYVDEDVTVNVSQAGWATKYFAESVHVPAGVNAYIITGAADGYVTKEQIAEGEVIPANTGVLLEGAGEHKFAKTVSFNYTLADNLMRGSVEDSYVQGTAYVLANHEKEGLGFYKAELNKDAEGNEGTTHFVNNAGKAYFVLPAASETVAFYGLDWENTTGVENVEVEAEAEVIYDLTGRRVEAITAPGIYIVNGKKVLVK